MFVELHILQNFAPSNLNRDDTGSPKDCEFGGYRRARISSQCLKRAMRTCFEKANLIDQANLAKRTKRLMDELVERLEQRDRPSAEAQPVVKAALRGLGLKVADEKKTEYLLYLSQAEIERLADLCAEHWDELTAVATAAAATAGQLKRKDAKKAGKEAIPVELKKALESVLDGRRAADLALFGRMLADKPEKNVDAAAQVAHAISTNRVSMEFDFYTAVDDLKPDDTAGADMLGTVEFNSACFYRYANVDLEQLRENLEDEDLAQQTLRAFLRAAIEAVPTGKQNSMAAQNPPSFVLAVVRKHGLWSLANAFAQPVRPDHQGDLIQNSIAALEDYWDKLTKMYGTDSIVGKWCATLGGSVKHLRADQVETVDDLVDRVLAAAWSRVGEEVGAK